LVEAAKGKAARFRFADEISYIERRAAASPVNVKDFRT
jgi:hypothetical protein